MASGCVTEHCFGIDVFMSHYLRSQFFSFAAFLQQAMGLLFNARALCPGGVASVAVSPRLYSHRALDGFAVLASEQG